MFRDGGLCVNNNSRRLPFFCARSTGKTDQHLKKKTMRERFGKCFAMQSFEEIPSGDDLIEIRDGIAPAASLARLLSVALAKVLRGRKGRSVVVKRVLRLR